VASFWLSQVAATKVLHFQFSHNIHSQVLQARGVPALLEKYPRTKFHQKSLFKLTLMLSYQYLNLEMSRDHGFQNFFATLGTAQPQLVWLLFA